MPEIDITVTSPISNSARAAQVSSMFDVPPTERATLNWHGQLPIEQQPWQIGLIVGPSGSGKTTILNRIFGAPLSFEWPGASVIDDFDRRHSVETVARICQAVGFNTIPAWLRPYAVLSNGERFRVDLARRLLEGDDHGTPSNAFDGKPAVVCDEFTSVVDRQVAKIGAHAVQKFIRRDASRRFVAATCHYDLEDWLQPDWIFDPATMDFRWRSLQRRPPLDCEIHRVDHRAWSAFARFHYLTADLPPASRCYRLSVSGIPAAFAAVVYRPHAKSKNIYGMSRLVTLPDFQGLGLAFVLADRVASAYRAAARRYHAYPAHPMLIRSFDRSPVWDLVSPPGRPSRRNVNISSAPDMAGGFGGRPNAVFAYCGPAMEDRDLAARLVVAT
jgi:GNAT superfamily N-acetyltransferase